MAELPPNNQQEDDEVEFSVPIEVEIYIDADGTVTFADLETEIIPLAKELDPDWAQGEGAYCLPEDSTTEPEDSDA